MKPGYTHDLFEILCTVMHLFSYFLTHRIRTEKGNYSTLLLNITKSKTKAISHISTFSLSLHPSFHLFSHLFIFHLYTNLPAYQELKPNSIHRQDSEPTRQPISNLDIRTSDSKTERRTDRRRDSFSVCSPPARHDEH